MSPIYEPAATKTQGNDKIVFVTTLASPAAPKIATEINAASSVEGTLAMYGSWRPATNVNTGSAPPRIGTTVQLPQEGNAQLQAIAVTYPWDPSEDDTAPDNKLKALLAEGAELYVVVRKGVDKDSVWTVGDTVDVWHVRAGYQDTDSATGDDEFGEYQCAQNLIPLASKVRGTVAA